MSGTLKYIIQRFAYGIIVILGVTFVTFLLTRTVGSPVYMLAGQRATEEVVGRLMAEMGLDQPVHVQYFNYLRSLAQLDFGISRFTFNPVLDDILHRLPATLELTTFSIILGVLWSIPLGLFAGLKKGTWVDRLATGSIRFGVCVPSFWLGLVLIYIFYAYLGWAPVPMGRLGGEDALLTRVTGFFIYDALLTGQPGALWAVIRQMILPAVTLAIAFSPPIIQLTRDTMINVMSSPFIRAARGYGLPDRVILFNRALRHLVGPVCTSFALTYGWLISGAVLVEIIFAWPGVGRYAKQAIDHLDYEPILGVVVLSAVVYVVVFLITDLIQLATDPRLRTE